MRVIIPALLILYAAAVAVYSFYIYIPLTYGNLEKEELKDQTQEMVYLQRYFERALKKGDFEEIQQEISSLGSNPEHAYALLADENDVVIAATRFDWVGKALKEVLPLGFNPDIQNVKLTNKGIIQFSHDRNSLIGYYPVNMGMIRHELRPTRMGVFFLEHDLSAHKGLMKKNLMSQLFQIFIFLALTALFIWGFIYFSLTRPMTQLLRYAGQLASGDLKARTGFSGNNEIASIGHDFDIMAEKIEEMHESLAEAGERLKEAQRLAGLGSFEVDTMRRKIILSDELEDMLGVRRTGGFSSVESFLEFFSGVEREHLRSIFNAPEPGREYASDCLIRRKDDLVRTMYLHVRVSGFSRVIGTMQDVTERNLAEEEVRRTNESFRMIFEQNQDAQLVLSQGSCDIIDANPAAVTLFGFSKHELRGNGPSLFIPIGELEKFREKLLSARKDEVFKIDRMDITRKDGSRITASVRGQLVNANQSSVVYCTIRDFTERIRMEEEARVMQAKLIQANKMTSVGTLASGIAHEINNPNNFIIFNSGLLTEIWNDAEMLLEGHYRQHGDFSLGGLPYREVREVVPELLCGIADGSRRIKGIVNNLKDFSRVDRAGLDGKFDVNRAVQVACSILKNQIVKYTDNFLMECAAGLPLIRGSAQRIEQVVINLILNAMHALPDKSCSVHVSTGIDSGSGDVFIKIRDEGIGMTKDVLDRVMEPFFTTKTSSGGTGLGLSISYTIVREHNGTLDFASEPGSGTTATLILPAFAENRAD